MFYCNYQVGVLMSFMKIETANKIYQKILKVPNWETIKQIDIGVALGYSKATISTVFVMLNIKRKRVRSAKQIEIRKAPAVRVTNIVEKEKCFCGECPPGRQSAECYSIEVAGRPLIDPSLDYLNSKSWC